ncbi:MAG: hypothetical protein QNJ40_09900 [Xanthomonadales bacterium]|nr:hypothetical protein [Xanthomonadales bacterium]
MRNLPALLLLASCAAQGANPADLAFLGSAESSYAWVLDSSYDPTPVIGVLDPPYQAGRNQLSRIDLATGEIDAAIALGDRAPVLAFSLSPDGTTGIALRIFDNALLVISGMDEPATAELREYPLPHQPLSAGFFGGGAHAVIGYQTGAGALLAGVVENLDQPVVHVPSELGIEAPYLGAVEAIAVTHDDRRVITQSALHQVPPSDPAFFTPQIAVQSHELLHGQLVPDSTLLLDPIPVLPPSPPFDHLETGVALGDFAVGCDDDRLVVPVSGALDLGQPDARVLILKGVSDGFLELEQTLSIADGVGLAPLQIDLAADCDLGVITNVFAGTVTRLTGIAGGRFQLDETPLIMPFPAEPAISPDMQTLVVHHPRPPLNGVPPGNVTIYQLSNVAPRGGPVFGEVRAWLQAKDRTLATWPPGLMDRVISFGWPDWAAQLFTQQLRRVMQAAAHGNPNVYRKLAFAVLLGHWLESRSIASPLQNRLIQSQLKLAYRVLLEPR